MNVFNSLQDRYKKLKGVYSTLFVLIVLFLVFFAGNLVIYFFNKPQSAYSVLDKESKNENKIMLQDTRVHNWDELNKQIKN